jgi:uncharacterized protein (DUF1697 family)
VDRPVLSKINSDEVTMAGAVPKPARLKLLNGRGPVGDDLEPQTEQAYGNVLEVVRSVGAIQEKVVKKPILVAKGQDIRAGYAAAQSMGNGENSSMTKVYLALLRGVNVGGKNKVSMAELKVCFEELGCENVRTYIASGNVLFESNKSSVELTEEIQVALPKRFKLDSELIRVLVLSRDQLQKVIDQAPKGFGTEPGKYHSDAIFLMGIPSDEAIKIFNPREGVDKVWQGDLAIYSQRLSAQRTRSRLSRIMSSPLYKEMTIRSWDTTARLLELMNSMER